MRICHERASKLSLKCRFCRQQIEDGSSVCPICKHYQSNCLIGLRVVVAALLVVPGAIGLGLFATNQWRQLRGSSFGSVGIEVAATSDGSATLSNTGGRDLFVAGIVFECDQMKDFIPINTIVKGGAIEAVEKGTEHKLRDWRCISGIGAKEVQNGKATIKNQEYLFLTEGHPQLSAHFDLEATHAVLKGTAKVIFRPVGQSQDSSLSIPCKVLIVQRANKDGDFPDVLLGDMPDEGLAIEPHYPPHKTAIPFRRKSP
jgi:hypothetical protein